MKNKIKSIIDSVYNGDESHPTPKLDSREIGTYIHIYEKGVFLKKSGRFDSIEK